MKNTKLIDFLRAIAPGLATALGGPLAGVATQAISEKLLGKPSGSFEDVAAAVFSTSASDLGKLKELDLQFQRDMKDAGVELDRISAEDRDSARARQAKMKDRTPSILGLAIILGFFGMLAFLLMKGLPEQGGEVLMIMIGALGAMTTQVGNYFFGSSAGSASKNQTIADLKKVLK